LWDETTRVGWGCVKVSTGDNRENSSHFGLL
jgi:hypothetical protein